MFPTPRSFLESPSSSSRLVVIFGKSPPQEWRYMRDKSQELTFLKTSLLILRTSWHAKFWERLLDIKFLAKNWICWTYFFGIIVVIPLSLSKWDMSSYVGEVVVKMSSALLQILFVMDLKRGLTHCHILSVVKEDDDDDDEMCVGCISNL
jgi:hypothetical protein